MKWDNDTAPQLGTEWSISLTSPSPGLSFPWQARPSVRLSLHHDPPSFFFAKHYNDICHLSLYQLSWIRVADNWREYILSIERLRSRNKNLLPLIIYKEFSLFLNSILGTSVPLESSVFRSGLDLVFLSYAKNSRLFPVLLLLSLALSWELDKFFILVTLTKCFLNRCRGCFFRFDGASSIGRS